MTADPLTVPCRYCAAAAGQPCRNKARDGAPPLEHAPGHPIRMRDADSQEIF